MAIQFQPHPLSLERPKCQWNQRPSGSLEMPEILGGCTYWIFPLFPNRMYSTG